MLYSMLKLKVQKLKVWRIFNCNFLLETIPHLITIGGVICGRNRRERKISHIDGKTNVHS
jgi:hypothetical protein